MATARACLVAITAAVNLFAAYGQKLANIGSDRSLGYADHDVAG
ncbi:hypothetical protein ACW2Q0_22550 [Nocardia sp. R16R-3T]